MHQNSEKSINNKSRETERLQLKRTHESNKKFVNQINKYSIKTLKHESVWFAGWFC